MQGNDKSSNFKLIDTISKLMFFGFRYSFSIDLLCTLECVA